MGLSKGIFFNQIVVNLLHNISVGEESPRFMMSQRVDYDECAELRHLLLCSCDLSHVEKYQLDRSDLTEDLTLRCS